MLHISEVILDIPIILINTQVLIGIEISTKIGNLWIKKEIEIIISLIEPNK